jgi:hypothetical protein
MSDFIETRDYPLHHKNYCKSPGNFNDIQFQKEDKF